MASTTAGHGFVWPDGLPSCVVCGKMANDPIHVTPGTGPMYARRRLSAAAVSNPGSHDPMRAHAYMMAGGTMGSIPCVVCGQVLKSSLHVVGAPAGMPAPRALTFPEPPSLAREEAPVVVEGERLVIATKTAAVVDVEDELVREFARQVGNTDSPHLWLSGRYVGADRPNRNAAYWSSGDLEMGEPTVAHGPVNWLHEERHVIGAIAGSKLVTRQAAADDELGTHIVALSAIWPWLYPAEAQVIRQASEAGSLWYSMECVSREVACLADGCGNTPSYRSYMLERETARCEHMNDGAPRRFIDPVFQGVGIIVPPVRPGWALADARVTAAEAESLVERQAAAFAGMADEDAVAVASHLLEASATV